MLTKYKEVRPIKGVNKPFKNVFMSEAYSEIFSGRGTQFRPIFKRSFFAQLF